MAKTKRYTNLNYRKYGVRPSHQGTIQTWWKTRMARKRYLAWKTASRSPFHHLLGGDVTAAERRKANHLKWMLSGEPRYIPRELL